MNGIHAALIQYGMFPSIKINFDRCYDPKYFTGNLQILEERDHGLLHADPVEGLWQADKEIFRESRGFYTTRFLMQCPSRHPASEQRCYDVVFNVLTWLQRPCNVVSTSCAG